MKTRKYLSISKKITVRQIQELFENNPRLEEKIVFDGEHISYGNSKVKITEDKGDEIERPITFDTNVDKNDDDLEYIIHSLEFYFGTKIWDYDDLSKMYNLYQETTLLPL
jgi:hypothetical protein